MRVTATATATDEKIYRLPQDWRTFAIDIDADEKDPKAVEIFVGVAPVTLVINLAGYDVTETWLVREYIELEDPRSDDGYKWFQTERYTLRSSAKGIIINEADPLPTFLAIIQPMPGPWRVKLTAAQTRGTTRSVRFLTY